MLKVIAAYLTTTELKLPRCQLRAQTISLILGNKNPVSRFDKC